MEIEDNTGQTGDGGQTGQPGPPFVEEAMREGEPPRVETIAELTAELEKLIAGPHTYGTAVYAMSWAATMAFNLLAHTEGVTGFQAGCAALDTLKRINYIEGPFIVLRGHDALYPQSPLQGKLDHFLEEIAPWLKAEAAKLLLEHGSPNARVHPTVYAHWAKLADEGSPVVKGPLVEVGESESADEKGENKK